MLLMQGMMTKFMHTNIFGEPNDYTLEKFGKIYIWAKSFTRMNLPMLLMQGMMTKFMHTNIFDEPNDYTLEKFGKAEGKWR